MTSAPALPHPPAWLAARAQWLVLAFGYGLLIVYGSLFPLAGWQFPDDSLAWLWRGTPRSSSRADNLANVLVYIPFGLALLLGFGARRRAVLFASLCGAVLSFGVETLQMALPSRVASITDLVTNTAGTAAGAWLALIVARSFSTAHARSWIDAFHASAATRAGVAACGLWALAHTFPFVPSIDVSNLRAGLSPVYQTLAGLRPFDLTTAFNYVLSTLAVAVVALDVTRRSAWRATRVVLFLCLVILLKVPVVSRQLSLEALIGVALVCLTLPLLSLAGRRARLALAIVAVLVWWIVTQTAAENGPVNAFNWVPFLAHLNRPLIGMVVMLEAAWPVIILAYALRQSVDVAYQSIAMWVGGLLTVATVFALEFAQQYIPGRVGDLTTPAIAAVVWIGAWRLMREPQSGVRAAGG